MLRIAEPLSRPLGTARCRGRMTCQREKGAALAGVSQRQPWPVDIPRTEVQQHLLPSAFLLLAPAEAEAHGLPSVRSVWHLYHLFQFPEVPLHGWCHCSCSWELSESDLQEDPKAAVRQLWSAHRWSQAPGWPQRDPAPAPRERLIQSHCYGRNRLNSTLHGLSRFPVQAPRL